MDNPYKKQPARAFWKRSVSEGLDLDDLVSAGTLIRKGEKVASAGSCFASNIVPFIEEAGFEYVRVEDVRRSFGTFAEDNFGYSKFSANYGNIYTVRQALQLVQRALGVFKPTEDRWIIGNDLVVDPFRPGLKYPAASEKEFDILTARHLQHVIEVFRRADVFVFTLGLTEAWTSSFDGAVFPACPGTIAGTYDPRRHAFHNFTVAEISDDLDALIALTRSINPRLRFVLTVSPVPLVATATDDHVLLATVYSKSVLRVAAGEAARRHADVTYFPAYEIVIGPQAPHDFFESDRREPSQRAIRHVMSALLARCETTYRIEIDAPAAAPMQSTNTLESDNAAVAPATDATANELARMSTLIADLECEEAAAGLGAAERASGR